MIFSSLACAYALSAALFGFAVEEVWMAWMAEKDGQKMSDHQEDIRLCLLVVVTCMFRGSWVALSTAVDIQHGGIDIPKVMILPGLLLGSTLLPLAWVVESALDGYVLAFVPAIFCMGIIGAVLMQCRGVTLFPIAFATLSRSDPRISGPTHALAYFMFFIGVIMTVRMPLVWDQRFKIITISLCNSCILLGGHIRTSNKTGAVAQFIATIINFYILELFSRRRRHLPEALKQCQYVRLGYLRKRGNCRTRMQDLPGEAFSDPLKAKVIVAVSHRWLDERTCDVSNDVLLNALRERIRWLFPTTLRDAFEHGFYKGILKCLDALTRGGYDTLFFFDFMSLPQLEYGSAGSVTPRRWDEHDYFLDALSAMGALYTTSQVLVMPEASSGDADYFASGWCFSEFCCAALADRLDKYSGDVVSHLWKKDPSAGDLRKAIDQLSAGSWSPDSMAEFRMYFEQQLKHKTFARDCDRIFVHRFVIGYLILRSLAEAIKQDRLSDVETLLMQTKEQCEDDLLNLPIDKSMDTVLHLAVRSGSVEMTNLLLMNGADPYAVNGIGDLANEFNVIPRCIFPRQYAAANQCKRWQLQNPKTYHPLLQPKARQVNL